MSPSVGEMSPAMQRRSVLLPEPERPRSATISPSRRSSEMSSSTGRGVPSGDTKLLVTWETSMMVAEPAPVRPVVGSEVVVTGIHPSALVRAKSTRARSRRSPTASQREPTLGHPVEAPPEQPVDDDDEGAHDDAPGDQQGELALGRGGSDVVAQPERVEGVVVPADQLGHDGRVPRPAGGGDPTGHVGGEDGREDDLSPALAPRQTHRDHHLAQIVGDGAGAGDDVEQDVPL